MPWSLITAPDERDRCCVVVDGVRCDRPSAFRVAGAGEAWDDYAYTCADHAGLVREPGSTIARVEAREARVDDLDVPFRARREAAEILGRDLRKFIGEGVRAPTACNHEGADPQDGIDHVDSRFTWVC